MGASSTLPRAIPRSRPRWYSHAYNRAAYYRLAGLVAPRLPRLVRSRVAVGLSRMWASGFAVERAAVRRNLARVCPGRDAAWLDGAVAQVFDNFAICFADLLSLNRGPTWRLLRDVAGAREQVATRRVLDAGRGCVSITAHLGNWELAGRLLATLGRRVHVVMAPEANEGVARALATPPGGDLRVVRLASPLIAVELVAALRRGEVVAFQMDRALGGRGDGHMPFLGAPARFPLGPYAIAAAAGVPVVPAFCILDARGGYRLSVESAFEVERGREEGALQHAVSVLERYVATHWDQWFNFFDVWTPPDPS